MFGTTQRIDLDAITLSVTTAGDGPAVLLLHGFPELGHSWRHQVQPLAEAGYRVVVPDQRGYGASDVPPNIADYAITELTGDAIALLDALEIDEAIVVGHDWGSIMASSLVLHRPDRARALVNMSVPFIGRGEVSPIEHVKATDPEGPFGYMLAFQEPGVMDELFDADPAAILTGMHWSVGGADGGEAPEGLPPHLTQEDLDVYVEAFTRNGFTAPINWYRNLHENWVSSRPWHGMGPAMPTLFIGGTKDFVCTDGDGGIGPTVQSMEETCADFRGAVMIEGAGHWVQQEAPDATNAALLEFLATL